MVESVEESVLAGIGYGDLGKVMEGLSPELMAVVQARILATLLVALGGASLLVLDPRLTMAEAMVMEDALSELIPPALPLIVGAIVIGTLALWLGFGRRRRTLVPLLVTQIMLVFLVGHNFAILGLVEMSSGLLTLTVEFVGITFFLAGAYGAGVMLSRIVRSEGDGLEGT